MDIWEPESWFSEKMNITDNSTIEMTYKSEGKACAVYKWNCENSILRKMLDPYFTTYTKVNST